MITGELVRIDIFVLARLCDYLDCSITDLIECTKMLRSSSGTNVEKSKRIEKRENL